jgi:two-component system chemotaxis sensor kinase CheA
LNKQSENDAKWFVSGLSIYMVLNMIGNPLRYYLESNIGRSSIGPLEFIQILNAGLEYSLLFGTCFFAVISFKRYSEVYEATRSYNIQLANWNRSLEAKVQERTGAIQNLLDNAGQGFLTIDEQLAVQDEHSSECKRLFQREIVEANFVELLYPDNAEERSFLEEILHSVFHGDDLRREVCLSLLPAEIDLLGKRISLQYKWITGMGTASDKVMIVMTDRSERRRMEHQLAKEKQALHMVVWVVKHYQDFKEMIGEYRKFAMQGLNELMQSDLMPPDKWAELYRAIHTFKGNFAQIDFIHTMERLHDFESQLVEWKSRIVGAEAKPPDISPSFVSWLAGIDLLGWLDQDLQILRDILGEQYDFRQDIVTIELDRLLRLEQQVFAMLPSQEALFIVSELKKLKYRRFRELLDIYPEYTARLAERTGKRLYPVRIVGGNHLVDPDTYSDFTRSLIHIFNNMVDHGIELPEQRASIGKDKSGTILCEIRESQGAIRLMVSNDGKELDRTAIREQALAKRLYTEGELAAMPDDELFMLIFREGFSTKEWVSKLSGRGIGLSAVSKALEGLNGSVRVKSGSETGTVFIFTIPLEA